MYQSNESDGLKEPLAIFAETMDKARAMLFPAPSKASKVGDVVPNLEETVEKEHKILLSRKSIIEKRKEEQERQQLEMVFFPTWIEASFMFFSVFRYRWLT